MLVFNSDQVIDDRQTFLMTPKQVREAAMLGIRDILHSGAALPVCRYWAAHG